MTTTSSAASADDAPVPGSSAWWAERAARLERRKPRADGLTIERIVEEAVALVDAEGLDALTVRRLAARLGTGSATLYRHVASLDELLVLLVDHVLGEVDLPAPSMPPRRRIEAMATGLRDVLLRHAGLVPALPAAPLLGPNARQGSEIALTTLIDAGFALDAAATAYVVLVDYVLGAVFFDSARAGRHGDHVGTDGSAVLDATRVSIEGLGSDGAFAAGLAALLDGFLATHASGDR